VTHILKFVQIHEFTVHFLEFAKIRYCTSLVTRTLLNDATPIEHNSAMRSLLRSASVYITNLTFVVHDTAVC